MWLEAKIDAQGTGTLVMDFRRYLSLVPHDSEVKVVLEAMQISASCCSHLKQPGLLACQMACRLMAAEPNSSYIRVGQPSSSIPPNPTISATI